jgi:hypothetical protein
MPKTTTNQPPLHGDGTPDDTAAIQARLDTPAPDIHLPPPVDHYLISRTPVLHSGQTLTWRELC